MSHQPPTEGESSQSRPAEPNPGSAPPARASGQISSSHAPAAIPDHELLRCIGRGAYGEVWLARNVLGAYRAVKVVYRDAFDHARPFDREFEGIQKFEPVSRTHQSQIALLHVGRNDAAGYFYYVMDLADDAGQKTNPHLAGLESGPSLSDQHREGERGGVLCPESYVPKTLKHVLCEHGRLPLDQCLRIGLALVTALDHLHRHGLVHRDVKPSNIIFVHDIPKIADIGLIASVDASKSYVGTAGYVPPEGPGTPNADFYSLGKVLYEMSSGRGREDFPQLPQDWRTFLDQSGLLELNAIILKACEANPARRYQSGPELHADLSLLQSGKSVQRLRKVEQRLARLTKLVYAAAAGIVIVAVAYVSSWREARRADREAAYARSETGRAAALAKSELEQRQRADTALTHLQLQKAEDLFAADQTLGALAFLARLIREQPTNPVAAQRLVAALTYRNFALPLWTVNHGASISGIAFSPDGQRLGTGSSDKTARLWDVPTGQPVLSPLQHPDAVEGINFAPDGTKIATVSGSAVRLWDATTGRLLLGPISCHGKAWATTFSPDGRFFANVGYLTNVVVRDSLTGHEVLQIPVNGVLVNSASFSPDSRRFVTIANGAAEYSPDGQWIVTAPPKSGPLGWVWDLHTGARVVGPLDCIPKAAHAGIWESATGRLLTTVPSLEIAPIVPFSPDSQRFATVTRFGAQVWDVRTGTAITPLPFAQRHIINGMEFSSEGIRIGTAAQDSARLWDTVSGRPVTEPLQHPGLRLFRISPDGQRLATYSRQGSLVLWDIRPGGALPLLLSHSNRVWRARFSGDGQRIVTASWDQTARIWDAHTGQGIGSVMPHPDRVFGVAFSPDGLLVATGDYGGYARVWNGLTGLPVTGFLRHLDNIRSARFSPDGSLMATASADQTACIWNAQTGEQIISLPHAHGVSSAEFHPDSVKVLTVASNLVQIWNARDGKLLQGPIALDHYSVGAQFSHDGRRFLTVTDNGTAQIWDALSGQPVAPPLKHRDRIWRAVFSPNDRLVATASLDNTARLWDSATGRALIAPLHHNRRVNWIAFNSDGGRVATATLDNVARVWDVHTGQPLTEPFQEDAEVATAEFSPDGKWIVTASSGNAAHVWAVPSFPLPAPPWLSDLAEALAAQTLDAEGVGVPVPLAELLKIKNDLISRRETDVYTLWARWFFSDRSTRPISPHSAVTTSEYVRRRIEENTLESFRESIRLSSTNSLAMARFARALLKQDDAQNPRRKGEADFYSRRALELSPHDPEVTTIRSNILTGIGKGKP